MTEAPAIRKHGKNAFLFVIVCVAMDMIGFGIIIPVMPSLLEELTGNPAEETIVIGGYLMATYGLLNFAAMPTIGNLSDRFGRRPVLLVSIATLGMDFIIMGLADSVWLLFVGRALTGISSATFSTANAYIADVTEPEERGKAFGMIGAAFGIGFIVGPALGGFLGSIDTRLPFFGAAALSLINFLYGYFVLPESLAREDRRPFRIARANPFGAVKHFSKIPKVAWFIVTFGIFQFAHSVFPSTWNFYADIRYDWSEAQIGLSLAAVGIGSAVTQVVLIGPAINTFGPLRTALGGILITIFALALFAFAVNGWMIYAIFPLSALGGVFGPSLNQIMSGLTPRNAQGELQGATASLNAFSIILAPLLMTQTLHAFSAPGAPVYFPGAAFLLASILTAVALVPFMLGVRANRDKVADLAPAE
ncbi:TCR/Tet family MFS transporter [Henriciella mobilis]|uniref:MFS transporter n=1 Tax=Henriciella mobilis TaxID=2305467 RepID=A0A399R7N4_9PROT|nr:TCR/Tet family MFS transporter [Henriciella mobilis]RIJ26773.1 MFS transporter [Henriciella mobilis]